jgi:hypothetical protein
MVVRNYIKEYPHGGKREGSGRKPLTLDGEPMVVITARVRPDQKEGVAARGGSEWLRQAIDLAIKAEKTQ